MEAPLSTLEIINAMQEAREILLKEGVWIKGKLLKGDIIQFKETGEGCQFCLVGAIVFAAQKSRYPDIEILRMDMSDCIYDICSFLGFERTGDAYFFNDSAESVDKVIKKIDSVLKNHRI